MWWNIFGGINMTDERNGADVFRSDRDAAGGSRVFAGCSGRRYEGMAVTLSKVFAAVLLATAIVFPVGVNAHHSSAMFDAKKTLNFEGTVREFMWTNPHCFIQVLVPSGGKTVEWSVEMASPSQIFRSGWRPTSLKPGQKIKISIHPMRDTKVNAGLLVSVTDLDGKPIGGKSP